MSLPGNVCVLEAGFAPRIVEWQKSHGRQHLPWQNTQDPFCVWLSEIMLQQTQVSTVLNYYPAFLQRFPDVAALAAAPLDDVLGLWSGLGYYSRARNLHRCAEQVVALHGGAFPATAAQLETLPGIGRSTAAAIAAFCFGERVAILDANVRRVLARVGAFEGDLSVAANQQALWTLAGEKLPAAPVSHSAMAGYTQGMMDLGATVCLPRKPLCLLCPVQPVCAGYASGQPEKFPVKSRKTKRSSLHLQLLWAIRQSDGAVWLEKRPAKGIWGGLYCLPVFQSHADLLGYVQHQGWQAGFDQAQPEFLHVLTHRDLYLTAWQDAVEADAQSSGNNPSAAGWFLPEQWLALGLPAPVRKLLASFSDPTPGVVSKSSHSGAA